MLVASTHEAETGDACGGCSDNGVCVAGRCRCFCGYSGAACEAGCRNGCSGSGTCSDEGVCSCDASRAGADCAEVDCPKGHPSLGQEDRYCSLRGECRDDATCDCYEGFAGDACQDLVVTATTRSTTDVDVGFAPSDAIDDDVFGGLSYEDGGSLARPPPTPSPTSVAEVVLESALALDGLDADAFNADEDAIRSFQEILVDIGVADDADQISDVSASCLLYTSPSPRDATLSRMPSSA